MSVHEATLNPQQPGQKGVTADAPALCQLGRGAGLGLAAMTGRPRRVFQPGVPRGGAGGPPRAHTRRLPGGKHGVAVWPAAERVVFCGPRLTDQPLQEGRTPPDVPSKVVRDRPPGLGPHGVPSADTGPRAGSQGALPPPFPPSFHRQRGAT